MLGPEFEILLVAVLTAVACALVGSFLVLRRMSLVSDAISHAILPGIVVGFLIAQDLTSPLLLIVAGLAGLLTVFFIETLEKSRLLKEDAAIGLVFPALFSLGVLLIAQYASQVHLDTDAVVLGEIAFVPFDRWVVMGHDLGPRTAWTLGSILLLNLFFLLVFYKELQVSTFDATFAAVLGFSPVLLHYLFMSMVALTVVGAFHAVGAILVVALMIAPPAAAYLLTRRLKSMLALSTGLGMLSAGLGYGLAYLLDVSIAGAMATMAGVLLFITWFLAPEEGVFSRLRRRREQRRQFLVDLLLVHVFRHQRSEEAEEREVYALPRHLNWPQEQVEAVVEQALQEGLVRLENAQRLVLTDRGEQRALRVLQGIRHGVGEEA